MFLCDKRIAISQTKFDFYNWFGLLLASFYHCLAFIEIFSGNPALRACARSSLIFAHVLFTCIEVTFSYPHKEFLSPRPTCSCTHNSAGSRKPRGLTRSGQDSALQSPRDKIFFTAGVHCQKCNKY